MIKNLRNYIVFASLLISSTSFAEVVRSGSVSISHNDNIPNASGYENVFSDSHADADISLGKSFIPAVGKTVLLSATAESRAYKENNGLNRLGLGGDASYTQRLGLGAYAPRVRLGAEVQYFSYKEDIRSSWLYKTSIGLEKRFTPALKLEAGLLYENRSAEEDIQHVYHTGISGDVFSQQNTELNSAAEYTFENFSTVTLRYRYRDGETDTSVMAGSNLINFSQEIAFDPALERGGYIAYLLGSRSQTWGLDWSYPLSNDIAAGLSYEQRVAKTDGEKTYRTNILSAGLTFRF